ncbi:hypothetical protein PAUR_a2744 [Pseudoalteromonas aurantia 208]|uniref:Uncharacterized protein n=1 Tax=Pseudoalteromonas aurantia 208 TaxID=1314867 RepID=A0ABR9EDC8_9GAMM|nr:hypothetical protein [Pseudoalteromonas aurantia 208]
MINVSKVNQNQFTLNASKVKLRVVFMKLVPITSSDTLSAITSCINILRKQLPAKLGFSNP